jgi:hypothetical protein
MSAAFLLSPNQLEYERKKQEKENRISRLKQVESDLLFDEELLKDTSRFEQKPRKYHLEPSKLIAKHHSKSGRSSSIFCL